MPRITFEDLIATLDAAIESGSIYNVDWKSLTSAANDLLDREIADRVNEPYFYAGKYQERTQEECDLYDAMGVCPVASRWPSKKVAKLTNEAQNIGMFQVVADLITRWTPVREKLEQVKPLIVKGKKPSDKPRKTPERTLENTGTCACCGRNVKRDGAGKIVMHGFTIRHGYQEGSCPGVGYDPVEVSDEGIRAYRATLSRMIHITGDRIEYVNSNPTCDVPGYNGPVTSDQKGYDASRRRHIAALEGDLRFFQKGIEDQDARIAAWTPGVLPG